MVAIGCGGGDSNPGVDATPSYSKEGNVLLQSSVGHGGAANAEFTVAVRCTEQAFGACAVRTCPATPPAGASAGTITVTGAAAPVSLVPQGTNYATLGTPDLYQGGEMLTYAAAGADVPAFTGDLVVTSQAQLTAPEITPTSADVVVDRTKDLAVTWTGGSGEITVAISANADPMHVVSCRFPASSGADSVPAAALAMLSTGAAVMSFIPTSRKLVVAGDYGVELVAFLNPIVGTAVIQ